MRGVPITRHREPAREKRKSDLWITLPVSTRRKLDTLCQEHGRGRAKEVEAMIERAWKARELVKSME